MKLTDQARMSCLIDQVTVSSFHIRFLESFCETLLKSFVKYLANDFLEGFLKSSRNVLGTLPERFQEKLFETF